MKTLSENQLLIFQCLVVNIQPGDTLIILADKEQGIAIPPKNTFRVGI